MTISLRTKIIILALSFLSLFFVAAQSAHAQSAQFILKSPNNNITSGQTATIEIYTKTETPINAAQINLSYPTDTFQVTIDSNGSAFGVKAQETVSSGSIVIAKGNIDPLTGQQLLAKLQVTASKEGQVNQFKTTSGTQILTSTGNKNIYTSTTIDAAGAPQNQPGNVTTTPQKEERKVNFFFQAIKEFFKKLFRF